MIGVDLGGTNVRAAAVYEDGSYAGARVENPSHGAGGAEATIEAVGRTILQAVAAAEGKPEAAGIAIPGTVNDDAGVVRWSPNLGETVDGVFHYWTDIPFRALLSRHTDLPAHLGNDANLAALGEYRFGTGKGNANCLVMFTLGTGIGNGVILSAKAVQGDARGPLMLVGGNKGGAEFGHVVIQYGGLDSTAGAYGAIEAYCQRDSIVKRAVYQLLRGRTSIVRDLVEGELGNVTPRILSEAAAKGDELAIEVWDEVGTYLGVGIGNAINVFAPDIVAVGGQVSKAGEFLLGPARKAARKVAIPALFVDAEIVQAEQIEDAGVLGGAALALQGLGSV